MFGARPLGIGALLALSALACGTSGTSAASGSGGSSGSVDGDGGDTTTDDAGVLADGGKPPTKDAGPPPPPPAAWTSGPVTCSGPGAFKNDYSGTCGTARWPVKTGTDSTAGSISLLPTLTTSGALGQIAAPGYLPQSSRLKPTETTVYAMQDARLVFARLEDDGDYHLVLADKNGATLIGEIPYPGGCTSGSAWQCLISKARASVDAQMSFTLGQGKNVNDIVSVTGVGFFDDEHGQYGAAPNGIELHPILSICFGAGCDPIKN